MTRITQTRENITNKVNSEAKKMGILTETTGNYYDVFVLIEKISQEYNYRNIDNIISILGLTEPEKKISPKENKSNDSAPRKRWSKFADLHTGASAYFGRYSKDERTKIYNSSNSWGRYCDPVRKFEVKNISGKIYVTRIK